MLKELLHNVLIFKKKKLAPREMYSKLQLEICILNDKNK